MDDTTRSLGAFVATTRFADLPEDVVWETKRRILDSVGCASGAFSDDLSATLRRIAGTQSAGTPARVWFTGAATTPELAGLANGAMVRYLDLSDTILSRAAGHPSDMIAALVALAEARDADGGTLISAIAVAYGIYGGLCDAVAFQKAGVDQSTAAALGASAGAGVMLGLDADQAGQALALALAANVNLYNVRQGALSDWKALAGPSAARNGVFAAQMAAGGLTGPSAVFDGTAGFKALVGPFSFAEPAALLRRITDTHLKAYPVCYHGQSAVDAAVALADKVAVGHIDAVQVDTYEQAFRVMGNDASRWTPENRETADHSIPFVVAVVLSSGGLLPGDYTPDRLRDPELRALMQRIAVSEKPEFSVRYPTEARTRITLRSKDGTEHRSETIQPKGHVENPLSDAELIDKLRGLWPATFDATRLDPLLDLVRGLESHSARDLVDHLCDMA